MKTEKDKLERYAKECKENEKARKEELKEKHEEEKSRIANRKREQFIKERSDWNHTLKSMLEEKRQKSADAKERKAKLEQDFERK